MLRGRSILLGLFKAVLLVSLCVLVLGGFFELYLRYKGFLNAQPAPYPCVTGDPVLNHVFLKNCTGLAAASALKTEKDVTYRTNSFGFRGKEPGAGGGKRLVVIGDSYTEGFGLEESETFPARLEEALKRNGARNIEVLNGGTLGYSPALYTKYFDRYFANLRPGFVLLNLDFTDFTDDSYFMEIAEYNASGQPEAFPGRDSFPEWLKPLVYNDKSALLRFVHQEWNQWSFLQLREANWKKMDSLVQATPTYITRAELAELGITECSKPIEILSKHVMELKQRVNSVGANLGIHMYPPGYLVKSYAHLPANISFVQAWDQKTRKDFSWACSANPKFVELMKRFAKRQGIAFFDSFPVIMNHPQKASLYFNSDAHWNSHGVSIVTESLALPINRVLSTSVKR